MSTESIVRVVDPRLNFPDHHDFLAISGSDYINSVHVRAQQPSNSAIYIQYTPSSTAAAVDRNMQLHCKFSITVTGTNTSTEKLLMDSMWGPSFHPMKQITQTASLQINGSSVQLQNMDRMLPMMTQSYDCADDVINGEYSLAPDMPDFSTQFLQLPLSATSTRSPLSNSYDSCSSWVPRGAFPGLKVVSNDAGDTTASFTLDLIESIVIPPAAFGKDSFDADSLCYVNNLQYNAQIGNLNKIINIAYPLVFGGASPDVTAVPTYAPVSGGQITITGVQVNLTSAELIFQQYSLPSNIPRPPTIVNAYPDVILYPTTQNIALAPGGTTTIQIQNQALPSVPRSIYIWAPAFPSGVTQVSTPAGCCWPVAALQLGSGYPANADSNPLSITFNNVPALAGYTSQDIYKLCKKNGTRQSWSDWIGMPDQLPGSSGTGSLIKLNMGEDVPLGGSDMVVGVNSRLTISANVTLYNQTQYTLPYVDLYLVCVFDGIQSIRADTTVINQPAAFTESEIAQVPVSNAKFKPQRSLFGGASAFEVLKSIAGPVSDYLKKSKLISRTIAPAIPYVGNAVGEVARRFGYGGASAGGVLAGGRRPRRRGGSLQQRDRLYAEGDDDTDELYE
jgi:hypothetical protein